MKRRIFTLSLSLLCLSVFGQDTLRHFTPDTTPPVAEVYPMDGGYFTGHNEFADEEFAEKYEISGSGMVLGIIAIHEGEEGTSSQNASYKVYTVGSNDLPDEELTSETIAYEDIPVDGSLFPVMFSDPAMVSESFFVSFNLGDYAHGGMGTKTIAVAHSPDGTRPSSDFDIHGRNAIRWHSHSSAAWRDYRTENFQTYEPAVYFSLFPVIELGATSTVELDENGSSIGSVFPNPASNNSFSVPVTTAINGSATFQLFDMHGRLITQRETALPVGKTDFLFEQHDCSPGTYFLLVTIPEGSISQKIIIK